MEIYRDVAGIQRRLGCLEAAADSLTDAVSLLAGLTEQAVEDSDAELGLTRTAAENSLAWVGIHNELLELDLAW